MKKSIFFLSVLVFFAFVVPQSNAQNDCGDNARSYVNANITTNGIRAITGAKMNVALNKIIDAIICRDSLATILQDSITIEIQQDSILSVTIFGQTVKDTIRNVGGSGGGGVGTPTNGLTTISGNVGLGGNVVQPTVIDINTNPFLIDCGGFYNYLTGGYTGRGAGFFNIPDLSSIGAGITGHGVTSLTKVISPTEIQLENNYNNQFSVGRYNGFTINYNNVDLDRSFWSYNDQPNNQSIGITLDVNGFIMKPGMNPSATNWTSDIFKIQSLLGDMITFKTNGNIEAELPTHVDEAAATLAGLPQNTFYKTPTGEVRIKL